MVIIIKNKEEEFIDIIEQLKIVNVNIELFVAAFMTLKAIEKYRDLTHVLIYTNKKESSELVNLYVIAILSSSYINLSISDFYCNALHSDFPGLIYDEGEEIGELTKFRTKKYGIISCVYLFGEGYNEPKLNGVTFAENMESDVRIIQYALRPNRLEKFNPCKRAFNIIPYIESSTVNSFEKCRTLISRIRNEDDTIESKINLLTVPTTVTSTSPNPIPILRVDPLNEDIDGLTSFKVRLKYSKALQSDFSEEQDEYNYVRQLNKELDIQSKNDYHLFKDRHIQYIEDPEQYFKQKGVWENWLHFLGIETKNLIKTPEEWLEFCISKNITSVKEYEKACDIYKQLPKNPSLLYENFTNVFEQLSPPSRR